MWYTRKDFTLKKKYILSIAFFLWFILAILINSNLSYDNVNELAINNKFETFAPTKKPASSPKPTNSDYELVFKKGHPVLFSSTDKAHEFWKDKKGVLGWKDRKDKKISYPDTTTNSSGIVKPTYLGTMLCSTLLDGLSRRVVISKDDGSIS